MVQVKMTTLDGLLQYQVTMRLLAQTAKTLVVVTAPVKHISSMSLQVR